MDRLRSIVSSQLDCQQKMGAVWVVAVAVGALLLGVTATYLASYSAISMMSRLTRDSYKVNSSDVHTSSVLELRWTRLDLDKVQKQI